jgi:NAD(P)-dependent dehydrogenase (short-subunit alcohol dehydrogenase family)
LETRGVEVKETRDVAVRIVVVAEVGSSLGRACAFRFASEGSLVIAVDHSIEAALEVSQAIETTGGACVPLACDSTDESQIKSLVETCADRWGRIDALVSVVGIVDWWAAPENSMLIWEESIKTNLLAPIFLTTMFRPLLALSNAGVVVIYGSIDGLRGNPRAPAYSVSRGGLIPFVHLMADEMAPQGIRINYVAGAAISPSSHDAKQPSGEMADERTLLESTPVGRYARPEDVSGVVHFLASSDSSYVNGTALVMDGGRTSVTPGTSKQLRKDR